ncbi:MAG: ATP-binding cassette domain-containing protein [Thermoleophilia bacterium]|nr:ATP-binding cassette domain-containing protein [Thermoleophilia bacterium]
MPETGRPQAAIAVTDLEVRYQGGQEPALRGVTLAVPAGGGLVVTGPEGCGRTSLVRALVGLVAPSAGSVEVLGGSPVLDPSVRRRVGYGPEKHPFPSVMRAGEAVRLVAAVRGVPPSAAAEALERVGLEAPPDRRIDRLEVEDVRRLSLACAVAGDPEVLVLDDPWEFPETVAVLSAAAARGTTILVATPDPGGFPALLGPVMTLEAGVVV